jgi:beta-glucosidase
MDVLFPFGYGLSYTDFEYSNIRVDKAKIDANDTLSILVDVTNTGKNTGKEVVQLYVAVKDCCVLRPVKELRGFDKIQLAPNETKTVTFSLNKRDFSYWNDEAHCFHFPSGIYEIQIAKNAREIMLSAEVTAVDEGLQVWQSYSMMSLIGDVAKNPVGKMFIDSKAEDICDGIINSGVANMTGGKTPTKEEILPMIDGLNTQPLSVLKIFLPDVSTSEWNELIKELNGQ